MFSGGYALIAGHFDRSTLTTPNYPLTYHVMDVCVTRCSLAPKHPLSGIEAESVDCGCLWINNALLYGPSSLRRTTS